MDSNATLSETTQILDSENQEEKQQHVQQMNYIELPGKQMHAKESTIKQDGVDRDILSTRASIYGLYCCLVALLVLVCVQLALFCVTIDYDEDDNNDNNNSFNECGSECDDINDTISLMFGDSKNKLNLYVSPTAILPGIQFFSYVYNLLQGKPPFDLLQSGNYHQIFEFTFDKEQVACGSKVYLVPDQFHLPAISGVCESQSSTSSISSATSASSLYNDATESSSETSSSMDASVKSNGFGFSVSGKHSSTAAHSNSKSVSQSISQSKESKTEQQYTSSKAILYSTRIRWDEIDNNTYSTFLKQFINSIDNVDNFIMSSDTSNTSNTFETGSTIDAGIAKKIVEFIGTWGTHVLVKGTVGAHCRQTTFFQSSYSVQSYEKSSESASSSSNKYSNSVSGGGSALGFSASVGDQWSDSTKSDYSSSMSASGETSYSAEYSTETTYCAGEVSISSICGSMLGTQDEPALIGYTLQPIYNLPIISDTMEILLKQIVSNIMNASNSLCGNGFGIARSNYYFWNENKYLDWDGTNYTQFWSQDVCFDQYVIGITMIKTIQNQFDNTSSSDSSVNSSSNINTYTNDYSSVMSKNAYYIRREYTTIKYGTFCNSDDSLLDVSFTLQSFPGNSTFGIEYFHKHTNQILSYFWINSNEITTIGAANYFLICSDITNFIFSKKFTIPIDHDNTNTTRTLLIPIDGLKMENILNNNTFCNNDINNIEIRLGFNQMTGMIARRNDANAWFINTNIVVNTTILNLTRNDYNYNYTMYVSFLASHNSTAQFGYTAMFFCLTDRIIESKSIDIYLSDPLETVDSNTAYIFCNTGTTCNIGDLPTMTKKLIVLESQQQTCSNYKVWTGIRSIYTTCDISIWTENIMPNSFELAVGLGIPSNSKFYGDGSKNFFIPFCTLTLNKHVATVDYIAICSGF